MNDAGRQLVRTRPPLAALEARRRPPRAFAGELFDASWSYAWKPAAPAWRGAPISNGDDDGEPCQIAAWTHLGGGVVPGVLRRVGPAGGHRPGDVSVTGAAESWFDEVVNVGTRDDGVYWLAVYAYGADVALLARSGVRVSWQAACCLHAASRHGLGTLHDDGRFHEALTPRRIRLTLFDDVCPLVDIAPIRFVGQRLQLGARPTVAGERRSAARAILALTEHPDPRIDALLRDPSDDALAVLRDVLLEREPVDALLADLCPGVGATEYTEAPELDDELGALWQRVAQLEPLIE